mgnify:CR=1
MDNFYVKYLKKLEKYEEYRKLLAGYFPYQYHYFRHVAMVSDAFSEWMTYTVP